jgi:predicted alpha/beta-hydrolase family hydrolase
VTTVEIPWSGGVVSGRLVGDGPDGVLLAHGAGTTQDHPFLVMLRDGLADRGHTVLTFNYPYTERGGRRPDPTDRLLACHRAAADTLLPRVSRLFLAGRSMGGRIGTHLAAEGYPAAGLILYAYPLHPAGKPEKLRVEQFSRIEIPMLFFQGTRDALSRMDLFHAEISGLPNVTVDLLEGATHSTRGGGWTERSMADHLIEGTSAWIRDLRSGETTNPAS